MSGEIGGTPERSCVLFIEEVHEDLTDLVQGDVRELYAGLRAVLDSSHFGGDTVSPHFDEGNVRPDDTFGGRI